jgi:hypothetical protein
LPLTITQQNIAGIRDYEHLRFAFTMRKRHLHILGRERLFPKQKIIIKQAIHADNVG